ncbi:hypothetical protein Poli38472_008311 [Pythium oligandrum]|uniref:Membrane-associated protein n=1 Tax=Pythium oligandrum TaxID=41045 RepID=A0A8K1FLW6_PYTOL|nr:hypothetical protein Poli38472_008311 [Pythium oligandrum]|eukprot:TMW65669.1 hypothetical protein Poli38472_008311 [Pythium oligandrum]
MWSSCVRVFIVGFAVLTTLWSKEASAALTITSTKVVVPDLVGLLYPQHAEHSVQFGSSKSATTYSAAFTTSPSLPTCDSTSFCLDVVVHSAFEFDPFVLVAYESKYPIASETFGNAAVVNEYPNVRPVVEGSGESGAGTGGNPGYLETLWRFNAVNGAQKIDVVFRLRQLSQWNSQKDQAIVHIATQVVDDFTSTTSVDAYVVYGNARIQHKTSQVQQNQVRLDIDITRNASQPNVGSEDAYPLVPIDVSPRTLLWSYGESTCLECTALLYGCTPEDVSSDSCTFGSSTAPLPSCLRSTYGLTSAWFVEMLSYTAGYQVPIKNWIDTCLRNIFNEEFGLDLQWSMRRWFNATRNHLAR